ncbi:hypothetical protein [Clostridium paridis]|uniref:Uncharacterized protein n=1 Tax=Clostridium paridis TaxID=2803863 RepID=A0A937FI89_9CLOT|nr:hypothetical protein [Clostridium paridis]MBL4933934.1 hypothetical protein [Clostridium paridis]
MKKELLKNKLKEILEELIEVLSEDRVSETKKNFVCGELAVLTELIKED